MKLEFTETVLRDANQSLIATRLPLDKFESVLNEMDQAGYYSIECWGGATFDSCIRYLNEDPWERLKILRKNLPNTKLQMLLRGQSLLGYRHYSDDVVRKFIYNAVNKGIDIIRIFDALNDINNIEVAVDETLKCGAHPSCAISYTVSPVHNIENYIRLAKSMESVGAESICIKDMAGILTPNMAHRLVRELKRNLSVPIILHSHCSTGSAYMSYLKAIEAGVDVIDTAVSSFSGGTSQPATEVMLKTAMEFGYEVDLNDKQVIKINDHFRKVKDVFIQAGALDIKVMETDPRTLENQIPGGMYSNLISQMKAQNIFHRFNEVLEEIPKVRKDMGYPPLVTPISQMVGAQATANVLSGKRYQTVMKEIKGYFRGEYGRPPGEVNKELIQQLVGKTEFPSGRISEKLPEVYEKTKAKYKNQNYGRSDILTIIMFPELANDFIGKRNHKDEFSYIYRCERAVNISTAEKIEKTVPDVIKAVIIAILAKTLNLPEKAVNIKTIFELDRR
jgi:oxaloacetate decarboxylase alpha subunit